MKHRKEVSRYLYYLGLALLLIACQTIEVGIERTPTTDPALDALATENARLATEIATLSITPEPTTALEPTASPLPTKAAPSELRVVFVANGALMKWSETLGVVNLALTPNVVDARISDDGQVVAYRVQISDRQTELWAVNIDGGDPRRLVSVDELNALDLSALAVSINRYEWIPGAHSVAYNTIEVIEAPGVPLYDDLHTVNADTREQSTLLAAGTGGEFYYAPDGSQIALVTPNNIRLMNADTSNSREVITYEPVLTFSEFAYYAKPVWAADSAALRAVIPPRDPSQPDQPYTIWHIPADGNPASTLGEIFAAPFVGAPMLSPDLSRIAYMQNVDPEQEGQELYLSDSNGNSTLYHAPVLEFNGWTPDSQRFVFVTDNFDQKQLGHVDGGFASLAESDGAVIDVRWVDDNRFLYLNGGFDTWELRLGHVDGSSSGISSTTGSPPPYDFDL